MRGALGGGWEPDEAMLVWTLSHAADDRTSSPVFQNGSFLNVWDVRPGEFGWFPEARIETGGGARVEIDRTYGSPGYLYLADSGAAAPLTCSAPPPPACAG